MRAKKISIGMKYLSIFSELDGQKVKQIIVGLLSEDLEVIKDKESLAIAKIIYSENNRISSIRRNAKIANTPTKDDKKIDLSTYPQKSYTQSSQSAQSAQTFPLASPFERMTKNYNNKLNITRESEPQKKQNCFNQHLVNCARVPIRTAEERKIYLDIFRDTFDEIEKDFEYSINPDNELYDPCKKIVKEKTKQSYINAMLEIIDTFIEIMEKLETVRYIHCGKERIFKEDVAKMAINCNYKIFKKILYQLAINPDGITNHPYYILTSIWKNIREFNGGET